MSYQRGTTYALIFIGGIAVGIIFMLFIFLMNFK
jgi:hypothetical protein